MSKNEEAIGFLKNQIMKEYSKGKKYCVEFSMENEVYMRKGAREPVIDVIGLSTVFRTS